MHLKENVPIFLTISIYYLAFSSNKAYDPIIDDVPPLLLDRLFLKDPSVRYTDILQFATLKCNERRTDMRQKFVISVDDAGKQLLIREYADIDKNRKYETAETVAKRQYSLLYKETYESDLIQDAIAKGIDDLVSTIRTRNMFPTRPFAIKIAESVVTLYESSRADSVELFFDDIDSEVV